MQLAVERIVTGMRVQADNHSKFAGVHAERIFRRELEMVIHSLRILDLSNFHAGRFLEGQRRRNQKLRMRCMRIDMQSLLDCESQLDILGSGAG